MNKEFTYDEKLALVARGAMDPKEIGLASAEEANVKVLDKMTPEQRFEATKLQPEVAFNAREVPPQLRAHWAMKDTKLVLPKSETNDWIDNWVEEHKDEHLVQARFQSGAVTAAMELLCTDPILGIAQLLINSATAINERYTEQQQREKEIREGSNKTEQQDTGPKEG